jgi:hypothetical protein
VIFARRDELLWQPVFGVSSELRERQINPPGGSHLGQGKAKTHRPENCYRNCLDSLNRFDSGGG